MVDEATTSSPPSYTMTSPAATPAAALPSLVKARMRLTEQQLESISREELISHWKQQDTFIDSLQSQATSHEELYTQWCTPVTRLA